MPSRLNALAAKTTNVSRVIAKIAGIESIANITSNAATITSAAAAASPARRRPGTAGCRRAPSSTADPAQRAHRDVFSGSTCSPPWRAIFTAVNASRAPSTYVVDVERVERGRAADDEQRRAARSPRRCRRSTRAGAARPAPRRTRTAPRTRTGCRATATSRRGTRRGTPRRPCGRRGQQHAGEPGADAVQMTDQTARAAHGRGARRSRRRGRRPGRGRRTRRARARDEHCDLLRGRESVSKVWPAGMLRTGAPGPGATVVTNTPSRRATSLASPRVSAVRRAGPMGS